MQRIDTCRRQTKLSQQEVLLKADQEPAAALSTGSCGEFDQRRYVKGETLVIEKALQGAART
jgi:hypothetical protein